MSRAIMYTSFGEPDVLELQDIPELHAGSDEVRVRVAAAGLNPMDWMLSSMPDVAAMFNVTLPSGFGYDFAGTIDEVGPKVFRLLAFLQSRQDRIRQVVYVQQAG